MTPLFELGEPSRRAVNAVFTDVHIILTHSHRTTLHTQTDVHIAHGRMVNSLGVLNLVTLIK